MVDVDAAGVVGVSKGGWAMAGGIIIQERLASDR